MFSSVNYFKKILFLFMIFYSLYISGLIFFMNGIISSTTYKLHSIPPYSFLNTCSEAVTEEICMFQGNMLQKFYSNHRQKVTIVLIDGLRTDFIPSVQYNAKFNVSMPYTELLLKNGSAISFVSRGFAPTVTLPRIKTLLTGRVANFIDILLNFNAAKLDDDNILKQASLAGMKSVFYGDDTWLKLFPNLFLRSEGTHSFFVSDFKEVDFNVSKHIKYEVGSKDWDILILHFLGVDHIGHAYGPFSKHLSPKLLEMDEIIKYIHEKMKDDSSSLIIVCGDHGMTASGNHGGITQDELLTPLIFISAANHQSFYQHLKSNKIIDQVDFAPTLSAILGLPIPVNSFGKIIPDVLEFLGFSTNEILYATYFNFLQMSKIYQNIFPFEVKHLHFAKETIEDHYKLIKRYNTANNLNYTRLMKSYDIILSNMKNDLLDSLTGYNDFLLIMGLVIMWFSILLSFYVLLPLDYNRIFLNISSKTILCILIVIPAAIIVCKYLNMCFIIILCSILIIFICQTFLFFKYFNEKTHITLTEKICLFFLLFHALSLFSSSYIEEEHQTWYYFTSSSITIICCKTLYLSFKFQLMNMKCNLKIFRSKCSSVIFCTLLVLISHRTFCKWNQVGNKWQHLPDISDWLNQKENVMYLGILLLISQCTLMFYFKQKLESLNYALFTASLLLIALQKLDSLGLLCYFKTNITKMLIPQTIYVLFIFIIVSSFLQMYLNTNLSKKKKVKRFIINFISAWILLTVTIGRTHNIFLIVLTLIQEYFLSRITWENNFSIIVNVICYFNMAMTSFSYYGNSNSLSTIDVFTGYTGIYSYVPFIVGFLIVCNTYSTLVLWFILAFYRIMHLHYDFEKLAVKVKLIFLYFLDYKLIVLTLYCTVMFLMRHHLFIYSVFFPKLFYELCHAILFSIIYFFISFVINRA